ncbi:XdhC family protein [Saccharopolyspora erythraea]|uniref:XdhC family protein n=1 Tax=Saccharopolyspora erythraea TaxID=1836 RepID=UPI001BAD6EC5|nr:XdhC/CoxI family protein [Saccharopolyspora erythraea]QUH00470.1 XdhC family protein [Saccharopolyspora erythraea]
MRDIAEQLLEWADAGERFAVASVVGVRGSAPRAPGAAMAVRSDGAVLGSLSGGCIEGSVHHAALESLATGNPVQQSYDYDPDDPFAVGLTCGGQIDVHIQPVDPRRDGALLAALRAAVADEPVALARVLATGATVAVWADRSAGSTADPDLDQRVLSEARAMLAQDVTGRREVCQPTPSGGTLDHDVFFESWTRPPRMLVFGAIDYAGALARQGKFLGYHVTVCDARAIFATPVRFPDADEVVVQWPHKYLADCDVDGRTVICVLTHDAKFDVPVLEEALRGPAGYIGALGSRRTHADRLRRLREAGLTEAELARLRSPIGLDLRASTPAETAVSIAAEIIALRSGASTAPLTSTNGPIHAHG